MHSDKPDAKRQDFNRVDRVRTFGALRYQSSCAAKRAPLVKFKFMRSVKHLDSTNYSQKLLQLTETHGLAGH